MRKAIGLLGGSFNPIHFGHLQMAQAAKDALGLHRVILMPAGDPPHKEKELAGKYDRLRMVELAAGDAFEVSTAEVGRPGKTYTVDTLEALAIAHPDTEVVLLIGADTLHEISGWRNAPRVFELCRFAVFDRGGQPLTQVPGAAVLRVDAAIAGISATGIRQRVRQGMSLEGYTPQPVIDYIGRQRLYNPPARMRKKDVRKRLRADLPPSRFAHVLGVEATVKELAQRWGYSVKTAGITGLLHDCAKGMPLDALAQMVDHNGVQVDELRRKSRELLHAPASAAMARAVYGETDPDVLHAIWYHNTGSIAMGKLDKLLYVADMIEPGRKTSPALEAVRQMAAQDLDEAVAMALRRKLGYIEERGGFVHPDTKAALAAMQKDDHKEGTI